MFDVPRAAMSRVEWHLSFDLPENWNVGLIVGPSGSGKTLTARKMFGDHFHPELEWNGASVVDDFAKDQPMQAISEACQAVGFNTIPSWMRPFAVLSNGEKFRVELARRLLELPSPIVVDEFSSVIDRQVAQIGSHAVQKFARKTGKQFVAVSCHYDIVEWLQPDWILEPATASFTPRGSLQGRPKLDIEICRVGYEAWKLFAPYHYLTADLHRSARCYCLFVGGRPAAFGGMLHRPHAKVNDIMGLSRLVTLPDWQGLGLAMVLADTLGSAYRAIGKRMHTYPAHPALIRSFDKSPRWRLDKKPGTYSPRTGSGSKLAGSKQGGRPCAVFEYCGARMDEAQARNLLATSY